MAQERNRTTDERRDRMTDERQDCTTTKSFADHDVDDGSILIQRTYYRLANDGSPTFDPTESFFHGLESAFLWAYMATVEGNDVPNHVQAAVDDARVRTTEEFADRPDAAVRTEVVPAFYRHAAAFHCSYRE